jgi:hypothetical protein
MWNNNQGSGDPDTDTNLVFKVDKNKLFMRGSGEFTGELKSGGTIEDPAFHVDTEGNVTIKGNITWGASASPT